MITFYSWARSAARPAALDRPGRPSPAWLRLSLVILGLQIAAGLLIPGDGLVTCAGFAAQCVLAASFAGRRATGDRLRWHWLTLAAALACWAGGYVAIGVEENLVGPDPATGLLNDVLSMLKAAPFLLLLTAGLDASASRPLLRLDLAAVLIFALTAAALILGDPFGSGAREASVSIRDVRDIENIALAVLALATQRVQRRTADRALYRAVAWLLGGYLVSATLLNHVIIERLPDSPGSAWMAIGSLPFALFHAAALSGSLSTSRPRPRWVAPLRYLAPSLLAAASLLFAFAVARRGDPSGMAFGLAAVAIYAVRTSIERREVRAANVALRRTGRRLATLALTDTLTGVANRRKFDAALTEAWAEAEREGTTLGVLFIDVDWFKPYNDLLGHAAGDACLRRLAQALDAAVGPSATFARLGGEEFAVVGVRGEAAVRHAERLRRLVEQMELPHPGSPLGHVTVSVGVASGTPGDTAPTASAMLAAADRALYAAKAGGRNRVVETGRGRGV